MENVVPGMVSHLRAMFSILFTFSFEIEGKIGKLPYSATELPHYNLTQSTDSNIQGPLPSDTLPTPLPSLAKDLSGPQQQALKDQEPERRVLATIRETLVPLQLRRQTFARLGNQIDISEFQVVPKPTSRVPLADVTNQKERSTARAVKIRDFLTTTSINDLNLASCGCIVDARNCSSMYATIAGKSMTFFCKNIDKVPARDISRLVERSRGDCAAAAGLRI
ncbi:hypothetical protein DFS34DRAFT_597109 [Phlyctochytrium arcticum]|nr:hypothetical protein DFS34DRAFT_597109 [Phlyctochytrium arcticum]